MTGDTDLFLDCIKPVYLSNAEFVKLKNEYRVWLKKRGDYMISDIRRDKNGVIDFEHWAKLEDESNIK